MSKPKKEAGSVSVTAEDFEELIRPLEQGIAVLYCAMDYACMPDDSHAPYLEPALSAAYDLLSSVKRELDNLQKLADTTE